MGFVVAAGLATVTVGALAVAVSVLLPETDTVALNLIVSPPGADFGTLTSASICGVPGFAPGSVSSQRVVPGLLRQLSTVKTGLLNAGVFAPGVSVVAIVPSSADVDQAEILNSTVLPGCTLLADAVTASEGFVGATGGGRRGRGARRRLGRGLGGGRAWGRGLRDGRGKIFGAAGGGRGRGRGRFRGRRGGRGRGRADFAAAGVGEAAGAEDPPAAEVGDAAAVRDATEVADGAAVTDALVLDGLAWPWGERPGRRWRRHWR